VGSHKKGLGWHPPHPRKLRIWNITGHSNCNLVYNSRHKWNLNAPDILKMGTSFPHIVQFFHKGNCHSHTFVPQYDHWCTEPTDSMRLQSISSSQQANTSVQVICYCNNTSEIRKYRMNFSAVFSSYQEHEADEHKQWTVSSGNLKVIRFSQILENVSVKFKRTLAQYLIL